MGLWNDMKAIGRAVNMNAQDVFYLFIGSGMRKPELIDELSDELDNYTMLDFQPRERLNVVLSGCHAHLVSLGNGLEGMAVPSKIYGILASGRPVIALVPDDSEIALLVREEECGIVINPSDSEALYEAVTLLKTNTELWKKYCINSRKAFEKKYTTKIISQKYKTIIQEMNNELSIT
jgi:glycosyltransferase involved in cell wall biosynthesis